MPIQPVSPSSPLSPVTSCLSSLHGTDSVAALHRFLDMGIEAFLIASSVVGVIGQRLLRRICDSCKEPYTPGADELAVFRQHSGGSDKSQFFHGAGCNFCAGTGYRDRIGVYELLRITPELRRLIVGWATTEELRRLAVAQGMRTMLREGMALVENDVTTSPRSHQDPVRQLGATTMPRFAYAAIDATGASVEGVTKADTIGDARAVLLDQNLYPVKIQEKRGALDFELTKEKVKKKELMHFTRQLAVFVKAGIPITEAMQIIGDETEDVALQRTITMMVDDLRNGGTLSEVAGKHPEAFPIYYIGILQSAELTGNLDETLESLAGYLERELETRSKVVSALSYPGVVMVHGHVHRRDPGRLRAAAVQAVVRGTERRPAADDTQPAVRRRPVQHAVVHPVQRASARSPR